MQVTADGVPFAAERRLRRGGGGRSVGAGGGGGGRRIGPTGSDKERIRQQQWRGHEQEHIENQREYDRARRGGGTAPLQLILGPLLFRNGKQSGHAAGNPGEITFTFDYCRR